MAEDSWVYDSYVYESLVDEMLVDDSAVDAGVGWVIPGSFCGGDDKIGSSEDEILGGDTGFM